MDSPASISARPWLTRRMAFLLLLLITAAGLYLRLKLVSDVNWSKPDNVSRLRGDEGGYDGFATDLLRGEFFTRPFRVPVYPMFLAGIYWAFGHSVAAAIVVQALLSAVVIPLTYWLGRHVTGRAAALIGAALVAGHYEMANQSVKLYTEVLYTVLLLIAMIAFYRSLRRPTPARFGVAGVLLGVLNLCRPTGALLPGAMFFALPWHWSIKRRVAIGLVYGLAMLLPIAPWTLHNYRQYGVFLPLAVSTGVLWQGSPAFYHEIQSGKTLLDVWETNLNPKVNGGHSVHTIEGDKEFSRRAIESIKAEPGLWLRYCVQKAAYVWIGNPAIDWPWAYAQYYSTKETIGIASARVLVGLGVLALIYLAWRRKLRRFLPMLMVCLYVTAIHAVTYPEARYGYPLHPFIGLMIGAAVVDLARRTGLTKPPISLSPQSPSTA